MKKPGLIYFKQNTAELPEGYRKPIKRRRKPAPAPLEPERIIIPVKMKAKPVIRRRTPRGRLMPLRMKNEWIPRNADWCQINGQKVRQDIFFGEVVGRVFIPGLFTGEACGSCGPSMFDFGGGCGDGGCEGGCDGGGGGGGGGGEGCASSGCEGEGCGTGGAACEGCAGCEGEGCASAGCESAGCASAGCESSGCAVDGCAGCASCADSGCEASGCSTGGGGGCDTGCTGCAGEGCGGCASTGCADSGCDTGCGMGCDMGCAATGCVDTGCGMGCVAPASDFGGWGQTAGVDYTGAGPGWGAGPNTGNTGLGNTIGAPSWATGNFGSYGVGGPTGTGFGPGAPGASIGGPGVYAQSPGVTGFPGDFNAPPGGTFGMPNSQDVGPQAGPGMPGGPASVQQGEGLGPGGFGIAPAAPSAPTVAPGDRSDVAPSEFGPQTVSGPQTASNQSSLMDTIAGLLGPSQAQAQTSNFMNTQDAFGRAADMLAQQSQNNPALMEALQTIVAEHNAQQNTRGPEASSFNPNSRADPQDLPHGQIGPAFDVANPNVAPGQQNFAPGPTGVNPQQGYQQLAAEMNAQQNQQSMIAAQELGEQGKGAPSSGYSTLAAQMTAQQQSQQAMQAMIAAQELGEQGKGPNTFDSRFGTPDIFAPTQEAPTRGSPDDPDVPPAENQTIGLSRGQDVISNLDPASRGVGREAAPLGLLDMLAPAARGSPVGNPYQAGSQFTGGRSGSQGQSGRGGSRGSSFGEFGPAAGRGGRETESGRGLSITVGGRGAPAAGYYNTGGRGIAPGAKGAEYGGIYGPGVATGRAGTNTFGVDSRSGAYGFYDPVTGMYYGGGRR